MVSPYTSRQPSFWQGLPRAAFVATGLLYATCSLAAEWRYAMVWNGSLDPSTRARHAAIAAGVFPLDPRLRMAPAQLYSEVRWPGSRDPAIAALREALADNPFAMDFRRNLAGYLLEAGDRAGAEREIAMVAAFSPRSRILLRVNVNPDSGGALRGN